MRPHGGRPPRRFAGAATAGPLAPAPAPTAASSAAPPSRSPRRPTRSRTSPTASPPATTAAGGYVADSQVTTGSAPGLGGPAPARPVGRLAGLLARLRDLAPVASLTQAADDITGATGVAAERLADARAERRALLRALGRATTEREIATLRERLRLNRSRLAAAKGALEALRRRARLATVDVAVHAGRDRGGGAATWTPRDALGDALRVLEVAAGVALVGAAALVPLAAARRARRAPRARGDCAGAANAPWQAFSRARSGQRGGMSTSAPARTPPDTPTDVPKRSLGRRPCGARSRSSRRTTSPTGRRR